MASRKRAKAAQPTEPVGSPPTERAQQLVAAMLAFGVGFLVFFLQYRALFCGETRGFDSLIYGRGIWGIARGDWWNSVRYTHTFAVHLNVVNLLLAPFTWFAKSALVLAVWQGLAAGGTTFAVARACQVKASTAPEAVWRAVIGVLCAVVLSAFVMNPFLNDARPDVMLVCLMTFAFLRVRVLGDWDKWAILLAVLATLCREEAAVLAAASLWLTPRPTALLSKRARVGVSIAFVAYAAFYFLVLRGWISTKSVLDPMTDFVSQDETPERFARVLQGKFVLLAAGALGGAPFIWRGWKWTLTCIVPLAALIPLQFSPITQVTLHYTMFCAPGLLLAFIEGLDATKPSGTSYALATLFGAINYFSFSVFPGSHFYLNRYALNEMELLHPFECPQEVRELNAELDRIPASASVLVSGKIGARLADRHAVHSRFDLTPERAAQAPDYFVAGQENWRAVAPGIAPYGYRPTGYESNLAVILTRDPTAKLLQWSWLREERGHRCDQPVARFSDAGIVICGFRVQGERAAAFIGRFAERSDRFNGRILRIQLEGARGGRPVPMGIHFGLAPLDEMPVGVYATSRSLLRVPPPITPHGYRLRLLDDNNQYVQPDPPRVAPTE